MKRIRVLSIIGLVISLLAACGSSDTETAVVTEASDATETTNVTATSPTDALAPTALPLSKPGTYAVGLRSYSLTDAQREGREVGISVWYPALRPDDLGGSPSYTLDADPDARGAPYPLIVSSTKTARIFAPTLVSHGFTWASVDRIDTYPKWNEMLIDQPLDILFALNQVASSPPVELTGMIDGDRAGATGYSFDGYNTLAMSGARIDPAFYLAQCPTVDPAFYDTVCGLAEAWDAFSAHAGDAITTSDDGLWQPMTDERIRAVLPMATYGSILFGEKGLAAVDRPTLIIDGGQDHLYSDNALIFEQLGTTEKTMITFVGEDHLMILDREAQTRMAHFMVAFFGYHLQGREEYSEYLSEGFVTQHNELHWGVVEAG